MNDTVSCIWRLLHNEVQYMSARQYTAHTFVANNVYGLHLLREYINKYLLSDVYKLL